MDTANRPGFLEGEIDGDYKSSLHLSLSVSVISVSQSRDYKSSQRILL